MYHLSDSLAPYAVNLYSGEPLTIDKAIYVSRTQRPSADDSLDTDLNQILPIEMIREKGDVVRFGDGRESSVMRSVHTLFGGGVFLARREDVPSLSLQEPDDRIYLIFNVRTEASETVILTLPGRGRFKIWLENTPLACDYYISRDEDMCILPLKKGDNFFTVQLEQNPHYSGSTAFSMRVYPADFSFARFHCPEMEDSYPREFLWSNTRRKFCFCWRRYEAVQTQFILLPRDFSFFSMDDRVSVRIMDWGGMEIDRRACRFGEIVDLSALCLNAPVNIVAEARGIVQEQVLLPVPIAQGLEAFQREYAALEHCRAAFDTEIRNNIEIILRYLSAERWSEEKDEGYNERNAILQFPGTGVSEELGYELYNAWRLLHCAANGRTYVDFIRETHLFTHAYRSSYGNTWQRIGLYFPNGYSPDRQYPLLLLNTTAPEVAVLYERYKHLKNAFAGVDLMIAAVTGRGVTTGNILCEMSVLDNLQELKRLFRIDENRIYLMGDCNGGYAAWMLAEAYPHLFAGVCAISGRPVANTLGNLSNLAVLSICESQEAGLGYYESFLQPRDILRGSNPAYIGFSLPEDHVDVFKFLLSGFAIRHLLRYTRCQYPRKIRYISEKDRHHRAYYLDILRVDRHAGQARIVSEINDAGDSMQIFTEGIQKFHLTLPPYLESTLELTLNGQTTSLVLDDATALLVDLEQETPVSVIALRMDSVYTSQNWGEGILGIFDRNITIYTSDDPACAGTAKHFSEPATNGIYSHTDIRFRINETAGEGDNLVYIGTGKSSGAVQTGADGLSYNGQRTADPYSVMWIEYNAEADRKELYIRWNDPRLLRSNIFLRRMIVPSPANQAHPYLNQAVLLYDGKQYYGAKNLGDALVQISGERQKEEALVWDFSREDARKHFVCSGHLKNPVYGEDGVTYEICGADPYLMHNRVGHSVSSAKTVTIRLRNDSPGCIAQLFYTTTKSPDYRVKAFTIQEHDTVMREYVLDMAEDPMWDGELQILRLDPAHDDAAEGSCTIGEIAVSAGGPRYEYARQAAFSQGVNHWYYQQSNGASYADLHWSDQRMQWEGRSGCTIMGETFSCGYPFTTVLRHICQRDGTIQLSGSYQLLTDNQNDSLRILHNQEEIAEYSCIETPITLSLLRSVRCGDSILFEIRNTEHHNFPLRVMLKPVIQYLV